MGAISGAGRAGAHVVFLLGDRVPAATVPPLPPGAAATIARLQQPAELRRILAAKFPEAASITMWVCCGGWRRCRRQRPAGSTRQVVAPRRTGLM